MNRKLTRNAWYVLAVVLGLAVAVTGFGSSFDNLSTYATTHGWPYGLALPIGLDLGIPALLILDWLRPNIFLRAAAWGLAGFTVFANGAVAGGTTTDRMLHAMMPAVAILIVEAARHLRDDPSRMDRIRLSRWLLAPIRTVRIWHRMVLWEITSYKEALTRETAVLHAQSVLMAHYRQRSWRKTREQIPMVLTYYLSTGQLPSSVLHSLDLQNAVRAWVTEMIAELTKDVRRRHCICTGPKGVVFLRRPTPARLTEPAGPAGDRVLDLEPILVKSHAPVVYFARNGNRVKIGTTKNLRSRMSALCLRVGDVVLVLHGGQEYEHQLHKRFNAYRIGNSEWFKLSGDLATFVATGGSDPGATSEPPPDAADADSGDHSAEGSGDTSPPSAEDDQRQERRQDDAAVATRPDAEPSAERAASERQRSSRTSGRSRRKNTRRPMDQWVEIAEPIWRQEFDRLHRQPTGIEFAEAIRKARLGRVSESTAKKIRTEILDRSPLPAFDETGDDLSTGSESNGRQDEEPDAAASNVDDEPPEASPNGHAPSLERGDA